jgi:hypothetical protein
VVSYAAAALDRPETDRGAVDAAPQLSCAHPQAHRFESESSRIMDNSQMSTREAIWDTRW